ncbi:D-alanyl-D-alanine carboxypeptidase [Geomonas sp. RF6]|uniref:D-alanyl-D-alanine carboxypeptidase family protein n=1 Tax=Geomonas sp. RF6 TaxID=2897342 RepID=UPI001E563F05|nr:D-alanyl-D-alanine carboxypeptidase family protein [Geomonas sp. RF6]UFS69042.1 D-alanyl-D-alanine carboxypeptidase [Geomonas sp. RF6]
MVQFRRCHIIAASLIFLLSASPALAVHRSHPLAASYLLQVNGETYDAKAANVKRAPASLTKIMTALLVLERCTSDQVVTVTRNAALETGSRIGVKKGQKFTVHSLLAATLMASANDACRALAEHVAGSEPAFVALMNARAKELHMENTRFTNVCGHDNARHYSTAADLAVVSKEALRHPLFNDLVSKRYMRISTVNGKQSYTVRNLNRLIGRYPGARGVKTGTTRQAGQCLVALVEREDTRVLLVMMRSPDRWRAAPAILNEAFAENALDKRKIAADGVTDPILNELVMQ